MNGRIRGLSLHKREALQESWFICETAPGADDQTEPPADAQWLSIPILMPATAALRTLGLWSLDGPTKHFDSREWWYRQTFDHSIGSADERAILGFDGLATVAQVWLNGVEILSSSSMFVSHECDVSSILRNSGNTLLIRFRALNAQLAVRRKRPRWRVPMIENQQLRWFRTTLLGRTPGWSPPAAVVGPWRDIWLERRRHVEVKDISLTTRVCGRKGVAYFRLEVESLTGARIDSVELRLEREGREYLLLLAHPENVNANVFAGEIEIDEVDLWWPHTHGVAALYNASVEIRIAGVLESACLDLGSVGFRTISLDASDEGFSLSINGVPVFCRGAVWTPLDVVTLRSTTSEYEEAIEQARAAGMNMLRIAGTMVYVEDHFFDACNKHGMMVWQDFMFANMDYPSDDMEFQKVIEDEVRQQLKRQQFAPCLAVLCGNSEVEQQAAMWGASRDQWRSELFEDRLPAICTELAPGTPYWPSSAHGGSFPHQANAGTTSYYGVGAYLRGFGDARRAELRFATECLAFANVPSDAAVARMPGGMAVRVHHPSWKARSPRDLGAGWDFDDVRDHYLATVFGVNPQELRYSDHDRYLTLSRMASGEAMAAALSEWRRPASPCNGALILFLRDLWAGAGWGLLDDRGLPKACYHYVKRTLQPIAVLLTDEGGNGLCAHVINEGEGRQDLNLEIACWRNGDVLVGKGSKALTLEKHSGQTLSCLEVFDYFMDLNFAYRFGPLTCDVVVATLRGDRDEIVAQTFYFPGGIDTREEKTVGLAAQASMLDSCSVEVTLRTERMALGVHFEVPGYSADDEYFHLVPGEDRRVTLRSLTPHPVSGFVHAVNAKASGLVTL